MFFLTRFLGAVLIFLLPVSSVQALTLKSFLEQAFPPSLEKNLSEQEMLQAELSAQGVRHDFALELEVGPEFKYLAYPHSTTQTSGRATNLAFQANQKLPWGFGISSSLATALTTPSGALSGQQKTWSLGLSQELWPNFGGRVRRRLRAQKAEGQRQTVIAQTIQQLETCEALSLHYAEAFFQNQLKSLEEARLRTSQEILNWAEKAHRQRRLNQEDYENAQRNYVSTQSRLGQIRLSEDMARREMSALAPLPEGLLESPLETLLPLWNDDLLNQSPVFRAVESTDHLRKIADLEVQQLKNAYGPHLKLKGGIEDTRSSNPALSLQGPWQDVYAVGLSLEWPLWNISQNAEIRRARAQSKSAELTHALAERNAKTLWANALRRLDFLKQERIRAEKLKELASSQETEARRKLRTGQMNFLSYGLYFENRMQAEKRNLQVDQEYFSLLLKIMKESRKLDGLCHQNQDVFT